MHRRLFLHAGGVLATATLLTACGGGDDGEVDLGPLADATSSRNIVQLAQATPDLSLLTEAVTAAGLADTLQGAGPFTVFAPTNAAFTALLTELGVTKEQLFADTNLLRTVLTYHVLPAQVLRDQVPAGRAITTVQGGIFKVDSANGQLTITDGRNRTSRITATDLTASNGVVHLVDRVLLPANQTIVQLAQSLPQFSILVEAVVAANLQGTLSSTGPFTVFAPTNDAFAALLTELGLTKDQLLADTALLTQVLTYHVLPQRVLRAEIPIDTPIATVEGDTLRIGSNLAITDQRGRTANIAAADVFASNGVVHAIDRVILPAA